MAFFPNLTPWQRWDFQLIYALEEQIIKVIKEHEAGVEVDDICRRMGISNDTFCNWRSKYAGLEVNEAKRLREL